jgi:Ca2+-binding RTX toxin-like protein
MRSIGAFSVLAIAGLLAVAGSASASTLAVDSGGTLRFTAARGEVNHVDLNDLAGPQTVVTDTGSTINVGAGCVPVTPHQASCPLPASFVQDVAIDLVDGNDFAHAFKLSRGTVAISGGPGDDTIEDLPQSGADVSGGPGDDTITVHPNFGGRVDVDGDAGSDSITAMSASGVVNGGAGADHITLNGLVELVPGTSAAYGGAGADTITANAPTDMSLIDGGSGADSISTGTFARVAEISGGAGADEITSVDGTSEITGGTGADDIDGGGDDDTIDCGLGVDEYVQYPGDTVTGCEVALLP